MKEAQAKLPRNLTPGRKQEFDKALRLVEFRVGAGRGVRRAGQVGDFQLSGEFQHACGRLEKEQVMGTALSSIRLALQLLGAA